MYSIINKIVGVEECFSSFIFFFDSFFVLTLGCDLIFKTLNYSKQITFLLSSKEFSKASSISSN